MALLTCPHCQQSVSSRAERCPHCGREVANQEQPAPAVSSSIEDQSRISEPLPQAGDASRQEQAAVREPESGTAASAHDQQMRMMKIQMQQKNVAVACVLTLIFGGLGLLYSSITWGIIAIILEIIVGIVAVVAAAFTFGLGILLLVPFHMLCVVASIVIVNKHNKRLLEEEFNK